MTDKRLETARMFYYKASHDLRAVEKLLPDGPLDVACFHAHQAVEKYLKAYLQMHDVEFPRTHDLDALLDILAIKRGATPTPFQRIALAGSVSLGEVR